MQAQIKKFYLKGLEKDSLSCFSECFSSPYWHLLSVYKEKKKPNCVLFCLDSDSTPSLLTLSRKNLCKINYRTHRFKTYNWWVLTVLHILETTNTIKIQNILSQSKDSSCPLAGLLSLHLCPQTTTVFCHSRLVWIHSYNMYSFMSSFFNSA